MDVDFTVHILVIQNGSHILSGIVFDDRLVFASSVRRGMDLGQNVLAVLHTVFRAHLHPFRIVGAIGAVHVAVPDKGAAGADLGPRGGKSLIEGHVVRDRLGFLDLG